MLKFLSVFFITIMILLSCTLSPETTSRFDYPPILAKRYADTTVRQYDTVNLVASACDSNADGAIVCYLLGRNGDGHWDDSSTAATTFRIANPAGGPLKVIWGARDNDGVVTTNTFTIRFNRAPIGLSMTSPSDSAAWSSYDASKGTGSVALSFSAIDPDGDTLTYTLLLGKDSTKLTQVYQGRSGTYLASSLDTVSIYYWRLSATDPMQQTVTASGKFRTGSINPIPVNGLVAYYPFNGNAKDESGNGNNGTVYGATLTTDRFGNANGAYAFNGINSEISALNKNLISGNYDFSIGVWFNVDPAGVSSANLPFISSSEGPGNQNKWALFVDMEADSMQFHINSPSLGPQFIAKFKYSFAPHNWYHILCQRKTNTFIMYLNGIIISSESNGIIIPNVNAPLMIGEFEGDSYFHGNLDDIRIYNRALSDQEIQALYQEGGYVPPLDKQSLSAWGIDSTSIRAQWWKVSGATGYVLESSASKTGPFTQRYSGVDTTFTHTGLTKNQQVWYRVKATNASQISDWSDTVSATASNLPMQGLVAYYPFNGNANDESGNGNNGVISGATLTMDRFGKVGNAYYFNGSSQIAATLSNKIDTSYTMCAWIKQSSSQSGWHSVVANSYSGPGIWTKESYFDYYVGESHLSSTSFSPATWYYVSITFSGGIGLLFINAHLDPSFPVILASKDINSILIGNSYWSEYFNGDLDDIRIYNRALSASEIQQLYHEGEWTGQ